MVKILHHLTLSHQGTECLHCMRDHSLGMNLVTDVSIKLFLPSLIISLKQQCRNIGRTDPRAVR